MNGNDVVEHLDHCEMCQLIDEDQNLADGQKEEKILQHMEGADHDEV